MAKKVLTTQQIIGNKSKAITKLNNYLDTCISDSNPDIQKKAHLLSSWLQQYVEFVSYEDKFDPTNLISYKRGNVVKVNFGFNVDKELGGPHYAIVIDKNNKHSAHTLTVIPLVSVKPGKKIYERDVYLGNELFSTLNAKLASRTQELNTQAETLTKLVNATTAIVNNSFSEESQLSDTEKLTQLNTVLSELKSERERLQKEIDSVQKLEEEISFMKEGSVARIEQITTVSKMRIWIPKNSSDVLYGISYSENSMKKINDKLKELYFFEE